MLGFGAGEALGLSTNTSATPNWGNTVNTDETGIGVVGINASWTEPHRREHALNAFSLTSIYHIHGVYRICAG